MDRENLRSVLTDILEYVDLFTCGRLANKGQLLVNVASRASFLWLSVEQESITDSLAVSIVNTLSELFEEVVGAADRGGSAGVMQSARTFNAAIRDSIKQLDAVL